MNKGTENPNRAHIDSVNSPGFLSVICDSFTPLELPESQKLHAKAYDEMRSNWKSTYWDPMATKEQRREAAEALYTPRPVAFVHEHLIIPVIRPLYSFFRDNSKNVA